MTTTENMALAGAEVNGEGNVVPLPLKPKTLKDFAFIGKSFLDGEDEPVEWLIDGLFPHPSAGMLYGWRGLGKTHAAISLALAAADKGRWLDSPEMAGKVERAVLYLDGEMSRRSLRRRFRKAVRGFLPAKMVVVPVEEFAKEVGDKPNLATEEGRKAIERLIGELAAHHGIKVELLVLDNWVSFVRGLDENDNAALGEVVNWMTKLRASGISVLFVHHASKAGLQRGASGREDLLDYVITLEKPEGWKPYGPANFIVNLEKTREMPDPMVWGGPLEAKLVADEWQLSSPEAKSEADRAAAASEKMMKLLVALHEGVAPANVVSNGKVRNGLMEAMAEQKLVKRKNPEKAHSPWMLTDVGQAYMTKFEREGAKK